MNVCALHFVAALHIFTLGIVNSWDQRVDVIHGDLVRRGHNKGNLFLWVPVITGFEKLNDSIQIHLHCGSLKWGSSAAPRKRLTVDYEVEQPSVLPFMSYFPPDLRSVFIRASRAAVRQNVFEQFGIANQVVSAA
jgi:hypothetical protein